MRHTKGQTPQQLEISSSRRTAGFWALGLGVFALFNEGCTSQLPGAFRLQQASQTFSSSQDVNTKVDMLWVIDNSASMDPSQKSLRNGFTAFAQKYMQPTWDIQVGVITTDTYLANNKFSVYRGTQVAKYPKWTADWGKLLSGNHDGPMPTLCETSNRYFYYGYGQCNVRDSQTGGGITGQAECLNPPAGQDSTVLCVNTLNNDNIHSGTPVVKTMLAPGWDAYTWTQQLVKDFMTNVSTGATGNGVERGLGSILQFIADNEQGAQGAAPNPLFRPGSLRVIIIVTDEDDQTIDVDGTTVPNTGDPYSGFYWAAHASGDKAPGAAACRDRTVPCPSGTCTQIPSTVDDNLMVANPDPFTYTYRLSYCAPQPEATKLMSVPVIKSRIDNFFYGLDGVTGATGSAAANYFVASVVPLSGESLMALHHTRGEQDAMVLPSGNKRVTSDYGARYVEFDQAVGNGSFEMELVDPANPETTDFTPILEKIGSVIVGKKATFILDRAPTGQEDMVVSIKHIDGSVTVLLASQFTVVDRTLTITDMNVVLGFKSTDQVSIAYQPSTVF
jgi:hypothetical protein